MRLLEILLVLLIVAAAGWGLWGGLRTGPSPTVELRADREAVGPATRFTATFREPVRGLVRVRLELRQGERTEVLGEERFVTPSPFDPFARPGTAEHTIEAVVGREAQPWLEAGEVTILARADRYTGPLASAEPVETALTQPVRLRPPSLQVVSIQHYVQQGGAGAVRFVVGEGASRSGVVAGDAEASSHPVPGGGAGERFVLYGIPFDLDDASRIRLFVEDAAGNRAETSFVDIFEPEPPARDTIALPSSFLQRVVPEIEDRSTRIEASGSLLDRYLAINGELRAESRARIAELSRRSRPERLWEGAFLQLPNSQRMARYAETRTYRYEGRSVDTQTHLGLDLASVRNAPVPAANAGIVLLAEYLGIYGNTVLVDHGYGLVSLYAHLSSIDVSTGDAIEKGQILGRTGATGLAGGDHLHMGIFVQGVAVDPIEWLDGKWIRERIDPKVPGPDGPARSG